MVVVFVLKGVVGRGWVRGLGRGWVVGPVFGSWVTAWVWWLWFLAVTGVFGCGCGCGFWLFLAWVWCFWLWFFEWVCSGGFQIGGVILIGGLGGGCGGRCWLW